MSARRVDQVVMVILELIQLVLGLFVSGGILFFGVLILTRSFWVALIVPVLIVGILVVKVYAAIEERQVSPTSPLTARNRITEIAAEGDK